MKDVLLIVLVLASNLLLYMIGFCNGVDEFKKMIDEEIEKWQKEHGQENEG